MSVGEAFTAPYLGTELRYQLKKFRFDEDPAPLNATIAAVANATCWSLALELLEYGHRHGRPFDLWGWNAVSWPNIYQVEFVPEPGSDLRFKTGRRKKGLLISHEARCRCHHNLNVFLEKAYHGCSMLNLWPPCFPQVFQQQRVCAILPPSGYKCLWPRWKMESSPRTVGRAS